MDMELLRTSLFLFFEAWFAICYAEIIEGGLKKYRILVTTFVVSFSFFLACVEAAYNMELYNLTCTDFIIQAPTYWTIFWLFVLGILLYDKQVDETCYEDDEIEDKEVKEEEEEEETEEEEEEVSEEENL